MPKKAGSLPGQLRKKEIVDLLDQQGSVTIDELCKKFNVTYTTIRSDLAYLEKCGLLERTYGGATRCSDTHTIEDPGVYRRELHHIEEKEAIAREAVKYIQEGDVIGLDIGSTTFQLAKCLTKFNHLTVVTCDLRIVSFLEYNTKVNVIVAGGSVDRHYHCTSGQPTRDMLSMLNVKKLFLSSNGVSVQQGISTTSLEMAGTKALMMRSAEEVFLLCDSSKLESKAVFSFASLTNIDMLITDTGASTAFLQQAEGIGLKTTTVKVQKKHEAHDEMLPGFEEKFEV